MIKHKDEKGREGTRDKGNERRKGGRERKEKKKMADVMYLRHY